MRFGLLLPAVLTGALAEPASAQNFNQFIGFGDSTIDSGSYRILSSPGGGATFNSLWPSGVANGAGKPTTSPGAMSSEALASLFGLSAVPADQGGTNFATSGAKNVTINTTATGGFTAATPTVTQIANYLAANNGHANGSGLYLISSGGNDISYATGATGTPPFPSNPTAYLVGAANSLAASVVSLQAAGARTIIVRGEAYSFPIGTDAASATARQDKLLYTQTLWSSLAAAGVNFIPSDYNAVRLAILANPAAFGFQFIGNGASQTACTQPAGVTSAWALLCSSNPSAPSHLVAPNADQTRLFADDQHLTTAGQKIIADYEYSLIVAPSEISFLAEAPVKTRAAMIGVIQNQIPISQRQTGPAGTNAWVTGDVASLKMSNYSGFPGDPGTPVALTAGIDMKVGHGWLIGAALSVGTTTQSLDLGGSFKQNEFAASLYAGYLGGPIWLNVVGTYGTLHDDVTRIVPIGITQQTNTGGTNGSDVSLAGEAGYNLTTGTITHGPLVGLVWQQVRIDGFTETGSFTSLGFGGQTRNSAASELGYQVSVNAGSLRPFAKVAWNHEWASTDRLVTATLTTISAPPYSMPAVNLGTDWGSATAGTTLAITQRITGLAAVVGQIGQNNVTAYSGQLGLNVAF